MKKILLVAISLTLLAQPVAAAKKNPKLKMTSYEQALIEETGLPLAFVRITSISPRPWTNANPPRLTLKLQMPMRGIAFPDTTNAIWEPMPYDISWAGADEQKIREEWNAKPMDAPARNSEWFVMGLFKGKTFYISPIARFPWSESTYHALFPILDKTHKNKDIANAKNIIADAARDARIREWEESLKASQLGTLRNISSLVAEATLAEMEDEKRSVQFIISRINKLDGITTAPQTIRLMGLPNELYSVLYDYQSSKDRKASKFLLFMKTISVKNADGSETTAYGPAESAYAIQPATPENLQTIGMAAQ